MSIPMLSSPRSGTRAVRRDAVTGIRSPRTAAAPAGRMRRLWRGPDADPAWARPALAALLLATAVFYLINLTASGYANAFYSAAAQAGSASWKAFFYGSLDAANSITVDKPPASLWAMALSVRAFGLNSFAILAPQVLMGVATVGIVYAAVKRYVTPAAGLIAGAAMALTPVAVLMFRFNNPDALLTLVMAAGAWATLRAVERGSHRWMAFVGVLIGLGFLTKTLQVLLVVPAFALAYLVAANTSLPRRAYGAAVGAVAALLAAGWWVVIVETVPASWRPYVGGSQTNSFLELTFGYNGVGRLSGDEVGSVGGGGGGGWGETGLGRLFNGEIGGQIAWLIPAALVLLAAGLWMRRRAPRTDLRRAAYIVWGGWLVVTALTFSFMAGIFHAYYTVALAPAVAALVGMGAVEAWQRRAHVAGAVTLCAATAAASVWGFVLLSRTTEYPDALRVGVLAVGLAAAALWLPIARLERRVAGLVAAAALAAALAGPTAYSITTVAEAHTGSIVTAGPATGGMGGPGGGRGGAPGGAPGGMAPPTGAMGAPTGTAANAAATTTSAGAARPGGMGGLLDASAPDASVVAALAADADRYTWVAATIGSQNAAGLQLGTGLPVMAIGGFNGSDPSPTLQQFKAYVAAGRIHYFAASGGGFGGPGQGGSGTGSQITQWVEANYTQVTIGGSTFYDLTQPVSGAAGS